MPLNLTAVVGIRFEGEPELTIELVRDGQVEQRIRMWIGWFDWLIGRISPGPSGWTGLALPYHLDEGWQETSPRPWLLPDNGLAEVRNRWAAISTDGCGTDELAVHGAVLRLLEEAQRTGAGVQLTHS